MNSLAENPYSLAAVLLELEKGGSQSPVDDESFARLKGQKLAVSLELVVAAVDFARRRAVWSADDAVEEAYNAVPFGYFVLAELACVKLVARRVYQMTLPVVQLVAGEVVVASVVVAEAFAVAVVAGSSEDLVVE